MSSYGTWTSFFLWWKSCWGWINISRLPNKNSKWTHLSKVDWTKSTSYPGLRLLRLRLEVKSQVIFKNFSKCGKFKQFVAYTLSHLLWYIVNNISPLNQSWFRDDEFFSETWSDHFGPGIAFAETCKGFRFLPAKRNILPDTYNISRNDVVEKKRCFTLVFPYFPMWVPTWAKCLRLRFCCCCSCDRNCSCS